MKKISFSIFLALLLVSFLGPWGTASATASPVIRVLSANQPKIDNALSARLKLLQSSDMITVIVTLRQRADISRIAGITRVARLQNVISGSSSSCQHIADSDEKLIEYAAGTGQSQKLSTVLGIQWFFRHSHQRRDR